MVHGQKVCLLLLVGLNSTVFLLLLICLYIICYSLLVIACRRNQSLSFEVVYRMQMVVDSANCARLVLTNKKEFDGLYSERPGNLEDPLWLFAVGASAPADLLSTSLVQYVPACCPALPDVLPTCLPAR